MCRDLEKWKVSYFLQAASMSHLVITVSKYQPKNQHSHWMTFQERTQDFFLLFSVYLFPKCELNLRRQATLTIKSSFTVSVNYRNSKIVEHSSQPKKIHKVLHSSMWLKSFRFQKMLDLRIFGFNLFDW